MLLFSIIVSPIIDTWEIRLLFFPIFTPSPIIQNGPIFVVSSISALFETTAEGWIRFITLLKYENVT